MSKVTSDDFKIAGSNISGVSQVIAQNEEAYNWLIEEAHMTVFADGSSALFEGVSVTSFPTPVMHICAVTRLNNHLPANAGSFLFLINHMTQSFNVPDSFSEGV